MSLMLLATLVYNNIACMYTSNLCALADNRDNRDNSLLDYCAYWDVRCFGGRLKKTDHKTDNKTDNICKTKKLRPFIEHWNQRQHKKMQVRRQQSRHTGRRNKFEDFDLHYIVGAGEGAERSFVY